MGAGGDFAVLSGGARAPPLPPGGEPSSLLRARKKYPHAASGSRRSMRGAAGPRNRRVRRSMTLMWGLLRLVVGAFAEPVAHRTTCAGRRGLDSQSADFPCAGRERLAAHLTATSGAGDELHRPRGRKN